MQMRLAQALGLALICCAWLLLFAVLTERPADKAKAFPRGEIVVGVDATVPPFAGDDGQAVYGLDIDLAYAIADYIELPIRFVNIGYYGLYDALISGEVDLLISALRIEAARMDDVRYSRHYFDNGLLLISPSAKPITALDGLAGQNVAFEFGGPAETALRKLDEVNQAPSRLPYELPTYALDSLRFGYADAAIVDATTFALYMRQQPSWQVRPSSLTQDYYAIAARHSNHDAWKLVDDALAALKESGELARIIDKWL